MKIVIKSLLLVYSLVFYLSANSQVLNSGLFWEISGGDLKQPSYLFGTYHLVGKNFLDTLPGVMEKLKLSKTVVGEVVMEDEMSMAQKLMPMMLLKDNTLDKLLNSKDFASADSFLKAKSPMGMSMLNGMKPAAVQIMILSFLLPKNISPENPALDMYFQDEAKKLNKGVIGLETIEEQGGFLFGMTLERQAEILMKTVRESDRMVKEGQELFAFYKRQDLAAIEQAFKENKDYTVAEMNILLSDRNKNWTRKMPEIMAKGSAFFAVGAGHLVGDTGLLSLLKAEGYSVKPLSIK